MSAADVLTPESSRSSPTSSGSSASAAARLLARRVERRGGWPSGELPDFLPETRDVRARRLADRAVPGRDRRPPGRDHGAGRPEDGHQRAQLGREGVHGRLRGRQLAHVGELHRGAAQPHRRARADDRARHRREALHARARPGGALRAPARLAPRGAPLRGRRRSVLRLALRLRALLLPQPRAKRALLLPAEARVAPRGAALERRLHVVGGATRRRARDDQGDRPDRDDPRRLRDGRDPLRAARPLRGPQRGPLGLHLQRDQEARAPARVRAARPGRGDDGRAVHALVLRAPREDVPSPRRPRDGREWRRSSPRAATPRSTRSRSRRCARTRIARRRRASTGRGSRTPTSFPSRSSRSTACSASDRTRSSGSATTSRSVRASSSTCARRRAR